MTDKSKKNVSEAEKQIDFGFTKVDEAKKEEKVREVFDSVAPKYDLMNDVLSFGMHRGWKHRCIREAEVTRGMKLLDIASGTCDLAIAFAHRTNAENITATDINYEMLSYGRQRLEQLGLKCAPLLKPFYDFYSFHFMPWLGGKIAGDADSYRYLAESIRMHPDQPTFANLMRSVGFSRVKWHNLTFGVCALHIGIKP